jgi:hypothetical protein
MTHMEFLELHTSCVTAMRAYVVQMEKTSTMLAECTPEPLSFKERVDLMSQGIVENDAHLNYLRAKKLLFSLLDQATDFQTDLCSLDRC